MNEVIDRKLNEIEKTHGVRVLYAVESGSRAWGFASPDSDYDVRFIYAHEPKYYLKLEDTRDVIECPEEDGLDICGWDLRKALKLLHRSNPTLFEWANSPVVYRSSEEWRTLGARVNGYFMTKPGVYHYLNMADGNYRNYLKGDMVRVKKYLYVLRPILACRWVLRTHTPPPMLFTELAAAEADSGIAPMIDRLLEIKTALPETQMLPRMDALNAYIEEMLPLLKARAAELPPVSAKGFAELERLFLQILKAF